MQITTPRTKSTIFTYFQQVISNPYLCFFVPFLIVLIGRFIIFNNMEIPQPLIEDEFSYLLAGDTFASFRMTNPMHKFWEHFETIHIIVKPSYMSKYPPMQGIILAMGQLFFGQPWIGVVLSMAIFCGLLPWAFKAWIPPNWSMLGALIATYKIGIISYWTDSYWGGGGAAIGGALVLGSVKRLVDKPNPGMIAIFFLGNCILINSRPFEGIVFFFACSVYLVSRWINIYKTILPIAIKNSTRPFLFIVIPVILLMGMYNYRITGNPLDLPYAEHDKQYAIWTPFAWQQTPKQEPLYRQDFIKRIWVDWDSHTKLFARHHPIIIFINNFRVLINFYFGIAFYFVLLMVTPFLIFNKDTKFLSILSDKNNRPPLVILFFYILISSIIFDILPHYTAPAAALFYLVMIMSLRSISFFSYAGIPFGKLICIIFAFIFISFTTRVMVTDHNRFLYPKEHFLEKRKQVMSILNNQPGLQLVFVRQGRLNDPNDIWVFNKANIDASKIVWANDITPEKNQPLIDYYNNKRTVWRLNDNAELTLTPYSNSKAEPLIKIKNPTPPILM